MGNKERPNLESQKHLTPHQTCYRKGHSTQTALFGVFDDIRKAVDMRKVTLLTLFDFSKAFDCIPHKKLLSKMRSYNISDKAIKWFYSYLSGRQQTVIDENGTESNRYRVSDGVPQGSVLGPLLCALFINDFPSTLLFSNHMSYANDFQIYHHCLPFDIMRGIGLIQRDSQAVSDWAIENGLELNLGKSKVMILGSEAYINIPKLDIHALPPILINNTPLEYVKLFITLESGQPQHSTDTACQ